MDDLRRKIMQHEIEEAALKKETDKLSAERLADIQKELAAMREEFSAMKRPLGEREIGHRQGAAPARGDRAGKRRDRPGPSVNTT